MGKGHEDDFGFIAPLPISAGPRKIAPEGFATGPEIGERLPDFELVDHTGRRVRLHDDRGDSKAAVVFFEKHFPRHIAMRESADSVIESALGELLMGPGEPQASGGDEDIRVTATFHGGGGSLKNGIRRKIVVRFELPDGTHIYGRPVLKGMIATTITVRGPDGLMVEDVTAPPTTPLVLAELDVIRRVPIRRV